MPQKFHEVPVWFTEDLEKLENWFRMGVSTPTIALKLGKSLDAVDQKIEQLKLRSPSNGTSTIWDGFLLAS